MKNRFFHLPKASAPKSAIDDEADALPQTPETQQALLLARMQEFSNQLQRLGLSDYLRYVNDRKRLFWSNFVGGMARGLGMAVGFTILGALLILFLQDLAQHNLPIIGDMIAEIVSVVQKQLQ